MIKVRLIAVGKVKESYFRDAVAEYSKRLSRFCSFETVEVKEENYDRADAGTIPKILSAEGERIIAAMRGYSVALAVEGRKISSEDFAGLLGSAADSGIGEFCFIIGGSYGLDAKVKSLCRDMISFSAMTFPHTLMRVVFTEQLYRAFTINAGSEYHK